MRPFLLLGGDKTCYDQALSISKENNFHFVVLDAKDFSSYAKQFYTSSLDGSLCLFYLSGANLLSIDESKKFIELIKDSPHRFILSASQNVNWVLKKFCLTKSLGSTESELTASLKILMTEPNRDLVRLALKNQDPKHLFHILKFGAWQHPDVLDYMIKMNRYIYILRNDYLLTMLSLLPQKMFAIYHRKVEENKLQQSIKMKLHKMLPNYTGSELADAYLMLPSLGAQDGIEFSDEEKKFLGWQDENEAKQTEQIFWETANLSDYL